MQVERDVRRQQQVQDVVGIKRQRVRVAGERLAASGIEVPPRNLAGAPDRGGDHLHRVVRGEVVAEVKEEERGSERRRGEGESGR